jgi:hypothetical protein
MYVPKAGKPKNVIVLGKIDYSRISRGVIVTGKAGRHSDKRRNAKVNERAKMRRDINCTN